MKTSAKLRKPKLSPHWKGALFVLWIGASLAWATSVFYRYDVGDALDAYARVYWYENQFATGGATKPHLKQAYHQALENSEDANRLLGAFFLFGMGIPFAVLALGTWLTSKTRK